jgi:hypothetical protein
MISTGLMVSSLGVWPWIVNGVIRRAAGKKDGSLLFSGQLFLVPE